MLYFVQVGEIMIKKINQVIKDTALPIYIAGHLKPDQDSICSSLALAKHLESLQKEVYVLLDKNDIGVIDWLNEARFIVNEVNHDKYAFIALDINEKKRLGRYEDSFNKASLTINIDHHEGNNNEADYIYSDSKMSSTCEMIYELIKLNQQEIDEYIANNLYSGIVNDTNLFSRRLSNSTLIIAQDLINYGANYSYIIQKTLKERSLYEFKALAKLINEIEYDEFHYVIIDKNDPVYSSLTHNQIVKKIAEDLRTIEGMDVFILLIKDKDTIVSKCMSNISANADKIACLFGGGGHKKEAGFTIKNVPVEDILKEIKNYIKITKVERTR